MNAPASAAPVETDPAESSPATRELTREEIGEFEGSEMLIGATVPLGQGEESPTPTPTPPPTQEDETPASNVEGGAENDDRDQQEVSAEAKPETEPTEEPALPEPIRQQIEQLTRERDDLKARAEAKTEPITGPVATPDNPLADVSDDVELAARQALAEKLEDWADEHRDGGELPRALQAALEGRKPEEITEPRDLSGDEARQLYRNARKMLRSHIPARREFLQHQRGNAQWMRSEFPEFFDTSTEKGQLFAEFERTMPQLKAIAKWPAALASMVEGHLALTAKYVAKNGQTKAAPKAEPPAAPVPPSTGARGGSASKPATAKPRRETALTAAMSDDEIMQTM